MTSARARRRIEPLEFYSVQRAASRGGLFGDLNTEHESFSRLAAERIAALEELAEVDAALRQVPRDFYRMVETLALQGIGVRIAKMQPVTKTPAAIERALQMRRAELAKIPADLRGRVEAFVKSYYATTPWRFNGGES